METTFSRTITYDKPVTRGLVLSLVALLRRLSAGECGCLESELGGGITLYRGPDAVRFETPEELATAVPPLEALDAFRMNFFCNPFPRPGEPFVSLFVGMEPGGSMRITASAASPVRAQELGLEIVGALSQYAIDQKHQQHIGKKPKKDTEKTLVSRLEAFNTVFDSAGNAGTLARAVLRLVRAAIRMIKVFTWL